MNKILLENLDQALDDVTSSPHVQCEKICDIIDVISDRKREILDYEKELLSVIDSLCAEFATAIRALQPRLVVTIQNNGCTVGYRTKVINCKVEPYKKSWDFAVNDFGASFAKRNPTCTRLDTPIPELAKCMVDYFNNHFASLVR